MYHSDKSTVICACLYIAENGSAEILCEDWKRDFTTEDEARIWLADEEFSQIEDLREEYGLTVNLPTLLGHKKKGDN